jgi:hypothetical protein
MKYFVAYEDYCELTQFGGIWTTRIQSEERTYPFKPLTLKTAKELVKSLRLNPNIKNVIGPLIYARNLTHHLVDMV